ncbi:hypothetical protein SGLAM104S_00797 [Streptomyces glaucescens]
METGSVLGVAMAAKTVMPMIMPAPARAIRLPEMAPVRFSMTSSSGSSKERPKTTTIRVTRSSRSSSGSRCSSIRSRRL